MIVRKYIIRQHAFCPKFIIPSCPGIVQKGSLSKWDYSFFLLLSWNETALAKAHELRFYWRRFTCLPNKDMNCFNTRHGTDFPIFYKYCAEVVLDGMKYRERTRWENNIRIYLGNSDMITLLCHLWHLEIDENVAIFSLSPINVIFGMSTDQWSVRHWL